MLMDTNGHTILSEDYVSFETAKLLKEKGFEGFTMFSYSTKGTTMCGHWENEIDWMPKCTFQMAMKWLREVHHKHCCISYDINLKWFFQIINLKEGVEYDTGFNTYEEACEAAIKHCLENLI